jgi:hypothetical protein
MLEFGTDRMQAAECVSRSALARPSIVTGCPPHGTSLTFTSMSTHDDCKDAGPASSLPSSEHLSGIDALIRKRWLSPPLATAPITSVFCLEIDTHVFENFVGLAVVVSWISQFLNRSCIPNLSLAFQTCVQ